MKTVINEKTNAKEWVLEKWYEKTVYVVGFFALAQAIFTAFIVSMFVI